MLPKHAAALLSFLALCQRQAPLSATVASCERKKGLFIWDRNKSEATLHGADRASNAESRGQRRTGRPRRPPRLCPSPLPALGVRWPWGFLEGQRPKHSMCFLREEAITSQQLGSRGPRGKEGSGAGGPAGCSLMADVQALDSKWPWCSGREGSTRDH